MTSTTRTAADAMIRPNYLELPHDLEAEQALLGSILQNRDVLPAVRPLVAPDAFYLARHADLYAAMLRLLDQRTPPDTRTLAIALGRDGLDRIGGVAYLTDLATGVFVSVHAEHYARRIQTLAIQRALIDAGGRIAALAYQAYQAPERPLDEVLTAAQHLLTQVRERAIAGHAPVAMLDIAGDLYERLTAETPPRGAATGLTELDRLLGALYPGNLYVLAARPGVGKTALALTMALAASDTGRVLICALEMTRAEIGSRVLAHATGLDAQRLHGVRLRSDDLPRVVQGLGTIGNVPIWVDDQAGVSVDEICARAAVFAQADGHPPALIVIDHLGLIRIELARGENEAAAVGRVTRRLKQLAKDLATPVLLLVQLNRNVEHRTNRVPQLSDLRDSGRIEEDADVVICMYREELYDKATDRKGIAELHIAKHRNGPLGVITCQFDAPTMTFRDAWFRTPEGSSDGH
jgi:replicative DNA helicase